MTSSLIAKWSVLLPHYTTQTVVATFKWPCRDPWPFAWSIQHKVNPATAPHNRKARRNQIELSLTTDIRSWVQVWYWLWQHGSSLSKLRARCSGSRCHSVWREIGEKIITAGTRCLALAVETAEQFVAWNKVFVHLSEVCGSLLFFLPETGSAPKKRLKL